MLNKIYLTILIAFSVYGQTIKDISNIVGIRENQLLGHGLIVGLNGTGDKDSSFSKQSLQNLLRNAYIKTSVDLMKDTKNIATVMVTASLPPFARQGDKIKLKISSIGDAKSIDGGQLLLTQLKGVDGKVYALAQGTIIANNNNPTTGFIYDGATVENEIPFSLRDENIITFSLLRQDATIAMICEEKINEEFGQEIAVAYDTRTIEVKKPKDISTIRLISRIQNIKLDTIMKKKIIIDPAKEMIIAGADITISPITIVRKDFTLKIKKSEVKKKDWGQPSEDPAIIANPNFSKQDDFVEVDLFKAGLIDTKKQPTISDLMRAMKIMKVDIAEIIDTIRTLDSLGAIDAEIEIVR